MPLSISQFIRNKVPKATYKSHKYSISFQFQYLFYYRYQGCRGDGISIPIPIPMEIPIPIPMGIHIPIPMGIPVPIPMEIHISTVDLTVMHVHNLGLYCILFRIFLISKINVALQLTKLWLKKVTTRPTSIYSSYSAKQCICNMHIMMHRKKQFTIIYAYASCQKPKSSRNSNTELEAVHVTSFRFFDEQ